MAISQRSRSRCATSAQLLSLNHKSHDVISKPVNEKKAPHHSSSVPVIRVIHVFNPIFVTTDAENFQSLVQKWTGRTSCSETPKEIHDRPEIDADVKDFGDNSLSSLLPHEELCDIYHDSNAPVMREEPFRMHFGDNSLSSLLSHEERCDIYHDSNGQRAIWSACSSGTHSVTELDVWAGLLSDGPWPDVSMFPPLSFQQQTREIVPAL